MKHIGIIGAGGISETHARAVLATTNVRLSGFYGQNLEKSRQLAQSYGGRSFNSFEEFLAHKPMDFVIIGSPSGLHAEQGIAAARRGLHVLTEKPIDITTERALELITECKRAGVQLGVCFQDRVADDLEKLKEWIDAGRLGKLLLVSARVKWFRPPQYFSDSRWRGRLSLDGGGALINQGIHTADLLLWLLGDVANVHARTATQLHAIEAEDTMVATLEFRNGAIGTLEATTAAYPGFPRRIELTGSEGTVVIENDRVVSVDLRHAIEDWTQPSEPDSVSSSSPIVVNAAGHQKLLEDFIRAIDNGGVPRCDGLEGLRSLALVEGIYKSARSGRTVTLNQGT